MSEDSDLDPDDPSVTGAGENRIDDDKLLVRDARGSLTSLDEKEYMHREQELVQREIQCMKFLIVSLNFDTDFALSLSGSQEFYSKACEGIDDIWRA